MPLNCHLRSKPLVASIALPLVVLALGLAAASPAAASAQTTTADRVRIPFPAYDGTLTPYTFGIGYPLVTLVYDTLLWRDAEGVPQPWLARSVTRSAGARRLTLRLRDGVRWHDGRPLTAGDVAFTLNFVKSHYQPRFTPQLADIASVRATGRLSVRIDLRRPSPGFDDQPLADVPILPRHLWQGIPQGRAPAGPAVGSGPYRLVRASQTDGYVLRANRRYFRGTPQVGEIRVPIVDDAEDTYDALRERNVDMVPLSLPKRAADELRSTIGVAIRNGPSYTGTMLVLNLRRPPFDTLAARRVVAAALRPVRIARNVAPAVAADEGFIHPDSRWAAGTTVSSSSPDTAQADIADLGERPLEVLAPDNDPVRQEAGRQVVRDLTAAGARAKLVLRSRRDLDEALGEGGATPDFDLAIDTIPALVSFDPNGLTRLFASDRRIAPLNASGYRSAQFDAIARRVASTTDAPARTQETLAALRLLARDVPAVPLFFSEGTFAYRIASYDGWAFHKGTGIFDKRSLLPGATAAAKTARPSEDVEVAETEDDDSGFAIVNILSLAVLALVLGVGAWALITRRADRKE